MKKFNLAVSLLLISMVACGQRGESVNPKKDHQEYQGYTIRLLPAMSGSYGYEIVKDKQLIVLQYRNPFTGSPDGLNRKEDTYKLAQWQIRQLATGKSWGHGMPLAQGKELKLPPALLQKLQMQGSRGPWINQRLSKKVAEELQINNN
ncbi:hypothetical protein [Flavisolibacter ginsengisoli]|jgi:hypothetical protein|uniref:Uncharacterized protein n=1 Tax=Flavisolibacter ginsengisoli DSM 18119 TaxID=1121884 RepID=A0A1M5BUM8_9BACT|nr:hypothetical protein [Flavisolibacter ginsengisoli]SHF45932.1 hypothetical protein SAMN02745131_02677 [Flavisolibacter ginsengisoli DSM 18119]